MKTKLISLGMVIGVVMAVQATDYVMLNPLDTAFLPTIPLKDYGGDKARNALENDALWHASDQSLDMETFSSDELHKVAKKLYRTTHRHYVTFPVAYWSKMPQGDSLLVSGRVYLPKERKLNGIIISNHFITTSDEDVPSDMLAMESVFTMKGYAVIMPDYVGYGLSIGERQPDLDWHNAVQTAVDMLDNMSALLNYYGYSYPADVVVTGYSQGGAVALGVSRMLEEQGGAWSVRMLYVGIDPYNATGTYLYSADNEEQGESAAIPLIITTLSDEYGLEFWLEDFFLEPLLSIYDEWIVATEYTDEQNKELMASSMPFVKYVYQDLR
jgi:hypothetical protein